MATTATAVVWPVAHRYYIIQHSGLSPLSLEATSPRDCMDHDTQIFVGLVRTGRIHVATRWLAARRGLNFPFLADQTELALAIVRLAQLGGYDAEECLRANIIALNPHTGNPLYHVLSDRLFDEACERLTRDPLHRSVASLWELMLALPGAGANRRRRLTDAFTAVRTRVEGHQRVVCAWYGVRDVTPRSALLEDISECIGTTQPFFLLRDLLVAAATSDGYPSLGDSLLRTVCQSAEWPILACLGSELELIQWETLTSWFLNPGARTDFTGCAREWIRDAVCADPDEDEPADE